MQFIVVMMLLAFTPLVLAAPQVTLESKCYTIADQIDRKYCQDKKVQLLRKHYQAEESKWHKGLAAKEKNQKQSEVDQTLAARQEQLKMLELELKILDEHKNKLAKAPVKKEKKKSKKKKRGNSLQAELEKALKVKL